MCRRRGPNRGGGALPQLTIKLRKGKKRSRFLAPLSFAKTFVYPVISLPMPGWRNWQTQRTQNPPRATSWGFDPPSRHQDSKELTAKITSPTREVIFVGGCSGGCSF